MRVFFRIPRYKKMRARIVRKKRSIRPRKARRARRVASRYPVFSETFAGPSIASGAGGVFTTSFNEIPQSATYAALYRTFRITKMEVMILPDQNMGVDLVIGGTIASSSVSRIAYAVNPSSALASPTSENQVLVDNGCKVRQMNRPLKISCTPQPALAVNGYVVGSGLTLAYENTTKSNWLDVNSAKNVLHNGISYWFSNQFGGLSSATAQVYYRVTFTLKDPQ